MALHFICWGIDSFWTGNASILASPGSQFAQKIPVSVSQALGLQDAPHTSLSRCLNIRHYAYRTSTSSIHSSAQPLFYYCFKRIYYFYFLCMCVCMYVCTCICKYLQVLEEGFRSSGARVMDGYEQPNVDTGNWTMIPERTSNSFNY